MRTRGKILNFEPDYISHRPKIIIELNSQELFGFDEIKNEKDLDIIFEKHFDEDYSIDSKEYCMNLCNQIAKKIGSTQMEVYSLAIRKMGFKEIIRVPEKSVNNFVNTWGHNGRSQLVEIYSDSTTPGFKNVLVYYDHYTYDSSQLKEFTKMLIQDCNKLGIKTPPDLNSWIQF